jgi:hypothetical protein
VGVDSPDAIDMEDKIDPKRALEESASGKVREQGADVLLVPVLGLRTTLEDRWASWLAYYLSDARKLSDR